MPADAEVVLTDHGLSADEVVRVARGGARAALGPSAREAMAASAALIEGFLAADEPVYGVTTGFGSLATTCIPVERTAELQLALIRSHAAGMGPRGRARGGAGDGAAAGPHPGHGLLGRPAGGGGRARWPCSTPASRRSSTSTARSGRAATWRRWPTARWCSSARARCATPTARCGRRADALAAAGLAPVVLRAKEGLALINGTDGILGMLVLALADLGACCGWPTSPRR